MPARRLRRLRRLRLLTTGQDDRRYTGQDDCRCPRDLLRSSGTIAVDRGWQIHADPTVLDTMAVDDLGRLLVHLVSHVLRDHAARAERAGESVRPTPIWTEQAEPGGVSWTTRKSPPGW